MTQKTLRVDAQLADRNLLHSSPLARGECAFAHSFLKNNLHQNHKAGGTGNNTQQCIALPDIG